MKFPIPKGLFDILPYGAKEEWQLSERWDFLEREIRKVARDYGYREIRTPIFETASLFSVGVGETSDIVSKEMYTFTDKGNRELALRPEGTSSVLRAFVEKNFPQEGRSHKLFYIGPMFRYERPQSGRYRQHHQFGIEAIGVSGYEQDAEVIDLLLELYRRIGLKNLNAEINSVGDTESRNAYRKALIDFLTPRKDSLSKDSQVRLEKNPLRILDSKDEGDKKLLKKAPSILDFLSDEAEDHFEGLKKTLKKLGISFTINEKIVRGLDYYNKTVFEITSTDLGAQNAIGGGGRYDGFPALFGGPKLPGIGFGTGMERILQTMIAQNVFFPSLSFPFLFLIPMGAKGKEYALEVATKLRHCGIPIDIDLSAKKIQDALSKASKLGAIYATVIGENEMEKEVLRLKNMETRTEEEVSFANIEDHIKNTYHKSRS